MKIKVLKRLKSAVTPYLFFWAKWKQNGHCNLTARQAAAVDLYLENNFELTVGDLMAPDNRLAFLERLIYKLESGLPCFKEFVIVNFLMTVYTMARAYGYQDFLCTPIYYLKINNAMKRALLSFQTATVGQIFCIYPPEAFSKGWLYKSVVEFLATKKAFQLFSNQKPIEYENR